MSAIQVRTLIGKDAPARPWRVESVINGGEVTYQVLSGRLDMPEVVTERTTRGRSNRTLESFAAIAHFANCHQGLVLALDNLLDYADRHPHDAGYQSAMEAAEQALAKARA